MKTQKRLAVLATSAMLLLSIGCSDRYDEGFAKGKEQGYAEGYEDGDADGFARAQVYFASADYQDGFNDGKAQGISIGYTNGYNVGKTDGIAIGRAQGYSLGYDDGHADGLEEGYDYGFEDGYEVGLEEGFDIGFDEGYDVGWDVGWDVGYNDGMGLSVGKSKKLTGYADIISAVHNELFDYSKIQAPKETRKGLVANGQLLLSETSLTNKDTLKRAAVVEQYLVVEMAKQVQGKFGLSNERAVKVAKAANHFRKFSSQRALTVEDSHAYASEIIGADFSAIGAAYENTLKGDTKDLNALMEQAAKKNGVSPEKMGQIVSEYFL